MARMSRTHQDTSSTFLLLLRGSVWMRYRIAELQSCSAGSNLAALDSRIMVVTLFPTITSVQRSNCAFLQCSDNQAHDGDEDS